MPRNELSEKKLKLSVLFQLSFRKLSYYIIKRWKTEENKHLIKENQFNEFLSLTFRGLTNFFTVGEPLQKHVNH